MKPIIIALIAGISAIACVSIAVFGFVGYKKSAVGGITATGSATCDFVSDLIAWRGSFRAHGETTKEAYDLIKRDTEIIRRYLIKNGLSEDEFVFSAVGISQVFRYEYNDFGNLIATIPDGYDLSVQLTVQSGGVDNVENISRNITELIDSGVDFFSEAPEYYYTKLDELKLDMIETATENARMRVERIAENSGSMVGELVNATLGVFQITAQNSAMEDYSYGGTFNTWSKHKTASVTVKLNYSVD